MPYSQMRKRGRGPFLAIAKGVSPEIRKRADKLGASMKRKKINIPSFQTKNRWERKEEQNNKIGKGKNLYKGTYKGVNINLEQVSPTMRLIVIEGLIPVGKSSLLTTLENQGWTVFREPVKEWSDVLTKYYQSPKNENNDAEQAIFIQKHIAECIKGGRKG